MTAFADGAAKQITASMDAVYSTNAKAGAVLKTAILACFAHRGNLDVGDLCDIVDWLEGRVDGDRPQCYGLTSMTRPMTKEKSEPRIIVRNAVDCYAALVVANAIEANGGSVVSIVLTPKGTHGLTDYQIWARFGDYSDELILQVDEEISTALAENPPPITVRYDT